MPMNAYNYLPHHHSIYDSNAIEEINVLTELISRIQLSNTNSLSELVLDKQSKSEFWETTNWISIFKYGTLGLICLITLTALSYLIIFCVPFKRICSMCTLKRQNDQPDLELTTPLNPKPPKNHHHSHTIVDPIKGLCWNDGCVIVAPFAPMLD